MQDEREYIPEHYSVPVPPEAMIRFVEVHNRMCEERPKEDWGMAMDVVASFEVFGPDDEESRDKRVALTMRMQALAQLLNDEDFPGWMKPSHEEGVSEVHRAVYEAAATQPMLARKNDFGGSDLTFDKESFLKEVFRQAKRSADVEDESI